MLISYPIFVEMNQSNTVDFTSIDNLIDAGHFVVKEEERESFRLSIPALSLWEFRFKYFEPSQNVDGFIASVITMHDPNEDNYGNYLDGVISKLEHFMKIVHTDDFPLHIDLAEFAPGDRYSAADITSFIHMKVNGGFTFEGFLEFTLRSHQMLENNRAMLIIMLLAPMFVVDDIMLYFGADMKDPRVACAAMGRRLDNYYKFSPYLKMDVDVQRVYKILEKQTLRPNARKLVLTPRPKNGWFCY